MICWWTIIVIMMQPPLVAVVTNIMKQAVVVVRHRMMISIKWVVKIQQQPVVVVDGHARNDHDPVMILK